MTATVLAVALPVLAVTLLLSGVRRPAEVALEVDQDALHVRLGAWDRVYALHGDLRVPRAGVRDVRAVERAALPRPGLRLPGTSLPGVVRAGSYGVGARRDLWDVRRADRLLVVDLAPGQSYRHLVLEVRDPDAEAARLRAALGLASGPV